MRSTVLGSEKSSTSAKKELLRKTLLEAAAGMFAEKGFGGTNLQDVADSLNISRSALYYYFKSKEDILASLVEEVTLFSRDHRTASATQLDFNPGETLRHIVFNHAKWLLDHRIAFRVIDRNDGNLRLATRRAHDRAKRAIFRSFARTLKRGIELGHFRSADPNITALAIIGMCNWTAWWFTPEGRMSPFEVAEMIAGLAVNAVKRHESAVPRDVGIADALQNIHDDVTHIERLINQPLGMRRRPKGTLRQERA